MESQRLVVFIFFVKEEDVAVIGAPVDTVVDAAGILEEFRSEILDDSGKVVAVSFFGPHCRRYYYHFFLPVYVFVNW
jgi:hypothetical protein